MESIPILNSESWLRKIKNLDHKVRNNYKAMYSSWWNGIVTDPDLMMIPVDDHQVHRGDAVFEAIKVIGQKIYLLPEHLDRLDRSSKAIGLKLPWSRDHIQRIIDQTLRASDLENAILRLFISRGPGSFSPSPYDTLGSQMYLIVTALQPVSEDKIKNGVRLSLSKINPKEPWLAQIKSCNYLQNVLMKKEAIDMNVDFTVGVNEKGFVTEGSTENLIILSAEDHLLRPKKDNILLGTMMERAFQISKNITEIKLSAEKDLTLSDLRTAKEIMMVGTTIDVLSVTQFENKVLSKASGPIALKLRELLIQDQKK